MHARVEPCHVRRFKLLVLGHVHILDGGLVKCPVGMGVRPVGMSIRIVWMCVSPVHLGHGVSNVGHKGSVGPVVPLVSISPVHAPVHSPVVAWRSGVHPGSVVVEIFIASEPSLSTCTSSEATKPSMLDE